ASRYYGFDPESVVVAHITIPGARNQWVQLGPVAQRLISDAKAIPGVTSAAVQVFAQTENGAVSVTDGGRTTEIAAPMWSYELVTPEYFRAIGLPIESGRDFADGAH